MIILGKLFGMFCPVLGAFVILEKYIQSEIAEWSDEAQGAVIFSFFLTQTTISTGVILWLIRLTI